MSNYAEQLNEKLEGRKKVSILEVNKFLDELFELSGKAVEEFDDADSNSDEIKQKDGVIEDLEDKIEDLEKEITPPNLLESQLKNSFDNIVESPFINQLKFLQLLEGVEKLEIKL